MMMKTASSSPERVRASAAPARFGSPPTAISDWSTTCAPRRPRPSPRRSERAAESRSPRRAMSLARRTSTNDGREHREPHLATRTHLVNNAGIVHQALFDDLDAGRFRPDVRRACARRLPDDQGRPAGDAGAQAPA